MSCQDKKVLNTGLIENEVQFTVDLLLDLTMPIEITKDNLQQMIMRIPKLIAVYKIAKANAQDAVRMMSMVRKWGAAIDALEMKAEMLKAMTRII